MFSGAEKGCTGNEQVKVAALLTHFVSLVLFYTQCSKQENKSLSQLYKASEVSQQSLVGAKFLILGMFLCCFCIFLYIYSVFYSDLLAVLIISTFIDNWRISVSLETTLNIVT